MPSPVRIRLPLPMRVYIAVFGTAWCGAVLVAFVSLLPDPQALIPLLMFAFGATFMGRMLVMEVVADGTGVFVRNTYRTRRYHWSQVEGFRVGAMGNMPFGQMVYLLLADGTMTPLEATMKPFARASRERLLNDLREWLPRR